MAAPNAHFFQFWTLKATSNVTCTEAFANKTEKPGDGFLRIMTRARKEAMPFLRSRGWPNANELSTVYEDTTRKIWIYIGMLRGFVDNAERLLNLKETNTKLPSFDDFWSATLKSGEAPWIKALTRGVQDDTPAQKALSGCLGDSKFRNVIDWDWTETLRESVKLQSNDAAFELSSVLLSLGQWYYGLAVYSNEAASANSSQPLNVLSYKSLLAAAGIFDFALRFSDKLRVCVTGNDDMLPATLKAWVLTCLAQAQEIALDWAVSQPDALASDANTILARVSRDLALKFEAAHHALATLDSTNTKVIGKWQAYLTYKRLLYTGVCYHYTSLDKVATRRGAIVLRSTNTQGTVATGLTYALECLTSAEASARDYVETDPKGAGRDKAGPAAMARRFVQPARAALAKHQVPNDDPSPRVLPDLPEPLCVVAPEAYALPAISAAWATSDQETLKWEHVQGLQPPAKTAQHRASPSLLDQPLLPAQPQSQLPQRPNPILLPKDPSASSPSASKTSAFPKSASTKSANAASGEGNVDTMAALLGIRRSAGPKKAPFASFGAASAASGVPEFAPTGVPLYPLRPSDQPPPQPRPRRSVGLGYAAPAPVFPSHSAPHAPPPPPPPTYQREEQMEHVDEQQAAAAPPAPAAVVQREQRRGSDMDSGAGSGSLRRNESSSAAVQEAPPSPPPPPPQLVVNRRHSAPRDPDFNADAPRSPQQSSNPFAAAAAWTPPPTQPQSATATYTTHLPQANGIQSAAYTKFQKFGSDALSSTPQVNQKDKCAIM